MEKIDELKRARDNVPLSDDHQLRLMWNTLIELVQWINKKKDPQCFWWSNILYLWKRDEKKTVSAKERER